jgi:hypothetical protein
MAILLEECVGAQDAAVPAVLEILLLIGMLESEIDTLLSRSRCMRQSAGHSP